MAAEAYKPGPAPKDMLRKSMDDTESVLSERTDKDVVCPSYILEYNIYW